MHAWARSRFRAIATDYDETLAESGRVADATLAALNRAKVAGLVLMLVTGRNLDELRRVFAALDVFDLVVAENGALLYEPLSGGERLLAPPPSDELVRTLAARGVTPLTQGRVIVATRHPYQSEVEETIQSLGLALEVILNKGAVMIVPAGVNKGFGLRAALAHQELDLMDVVGVGDAENDHSLLDACGLGVAVANALPTLKERADLVMLRPAGRAVADVIDELLGVELEDARKATPDGLSPRKRKLAERGELAPSEVQEGVEESAREASRH